MVMLANGIDTDKEQRKWQSGGTDKDASDLSEENQASSAQDQGVILANGVHLNQAAQDNSISINVSPEELRKARYKKIMDEIANGENQAERERKFKFYNDELYVLGQYGFPVENDLEYLQVGAYAPKDESEEKTYTITAGGDIFTVNANGIRVQCNASEANDDSNTGKGTQDIAYNPYNNANFSGFNTKQSTPFISPETLREKVIDPIQQTFNIVSGQHSTSPAPESGTSIPGVDSLLTGVRLSDNAYEQDITPEGFSVIPGRNAIDDPITGLQAKFLRKGNTDYVLVAGTNDLKGDVVLNWTSKGYAQFIALEPALREVIESARKEGRNVVVVGDSAGGMVAEHAHYKYGVDAFITNTTNVWPGLALADGVSRDTALYNTSGKMIAVVNDGEPLSTDLSYPANCEVYVIPSETGRKYQQIKDNLGKTVAGGATIGDAIGAHKDRAHMLNYLEQGGQVFAPGELNTEKYKSIQFSTAPAEQASITTNAGVATESLQQDQSKAPAEQVTGNTKADADTGKIASRMTANNDVFTAQAEAAAAATTELTVKELRNIVKEKINNIDGQREVLSQKAEHFKIPTALTPEQAEVARYENSSTKLESERKEYNKAVQAYKDHQPGWLDFSEKRVKEEEGKRLAEWQEKLSQGIKGNNALLEAAREKLKTPEAQAAVEERNKKEVQRLDTLNTIEQTNTGLNEEQRRLRGINVSIERLDDNQSITLQGDKNEPQLLINNENNIRSQVNEGINLQGRSSRGRSRQ